MSDAWILCPSVIIVGLGLMLWRRVISPTRFAQAVTAIALAVGLLRVALPRVVGHG